MFNNVYDFKGYFVTLINYNPEFTEVENTQYNSSVEWFHKLLYNMNAIKYFMEKYLITYTPGVISLQL